MKDLLIGAVDLYGWDQIKVWATSIRETGFDGDIALLTYRLKEDISQKCKDLDIDLYQIDYDAFGNPIQHNDRGRDTQSHQLRFFHAWQLLNDNDNWRNYNRVLITDVRDVWFQKNPFKRSYYEQIIEGSSEGIKYKDESWGYQNMLNGFGPLITEKAKDWTICNVGVIMGCAWDMMNLFITLYSMTQNRYIPSDQSAYNILVHQGMQNMFLIHGHSNPFACQCGTMLDPQKNHYNPYLITRTPIIKNEGVYIPDGYQISSSDEDDKYYIVHQWDRVPQLKEMIEKKYA